MSNLEAINTVLVQPEWQEDAWHASEAWDISKATDAARAPGESSLGYGEGFKSHSNFFHSLLATSTTSAQGCI